MSKAPNQKQKKNKLMQTPLSETRWKSNTDLKASTPSPSSSLVLYEKRWWAGGDSFAHVMRGVASVLGQSSNGMGTTLAVICSTWDHHHHQRASTFAVRKAVNGRWYACRNRIINSPLPLFCLSLSLFGSYHLASCVNRWGMHVKAASSVFIAQW